MEETVPQGITGREAETPLQAKPETAIPTAIRSGSPEEEVSAELTYRKDADTKEIAPQTVTSREAETPLQAKPETAIPTAIRPESPEEEASAELTYREDADAKEIVPQTASGREAEAPAQTKPEIAIPTAIRPISPEEEATAKLTYREDADGNVLHTAERADTKQTAPQTVTGREAEAPAQAKPETAIPTAIRPIFQEEEATTELTYREDAERNAAHSADRTEAPDIEPTERRADVRTQTTARRDTAIPAAIPSENPEAETPAELTYREKTEEGVRQRAESQTAQAPAPHTPVRTEAGESDRMRPEAAIPAAIPSANPETAVPAELTYRESTETNADQSASPHTDGTTGRKTAAQQFRTPFPQRGESHRAEPQIGETVLSKKGTGQTVREIRVTSEHGLRQPGAARSGKQSAEQTEQGAQKTQDRDVDRIALPVGEEIDGVRPPELFFTAPAASEQPPADPTAQRPAQPAQSDKTNELPKWAKELLDEAGVSQNEQRFALFNRDSGSPSARQISWTAPAAAPQQSVVNGRTELSFKENREAEQLPNRQMIGDAEIQRTADRIYKIIEERLRRELRRSGR